MWYNFVYILFWQLHCFRLASLAIDKHYAATREPPTQATAPTCTRCPWDKQFKTTSAGHMWQRGDRRVGRGRVELDVQQTLQWTSVRCTPVRTVLVPESTAYRGSGKPHTRLHVVALHSLLLFAKACMVAEQLRTHRLRSRGISCMSSGRPACGLHMLNSTLCTCRAIGQMCCPSLARQKG